jgi:hypothetical protein
MSLISRLLQRISGQSRHDRTRLRRPFPAFGPQAAQVQVLENRRLLSALTVTTAADSGAGSLRAEIAAANSGDTINFASSLKGQTITLTSGELLINKGLTIQGPGAAQLTTSGGHASRVFDVTPIQPVVLAGLTVSNGISGGFGGGIFNSARSRLTVSQCNIVSGSANYGGGIYNIGSLTVNQCTVSADRATVQGGGLFNGGFGVLLISGSTISNNVAHQGGGIFNNWSLTVSGSTISGNRGTFQGGGIFNLGGSLTTALTNCTLSGNVASLGGGLYESGSSDTLTNCTISFNSSLDFGAGGGICAVNGFGQGISLFNTIVAGNMWQGAESWGADIRGAINVNNGRNNLIGNGDGSDLSAGWRGSIVGHSFNVINARLGPLQNNGGPTMTMALVAGSPAIGHADNALAPATDQRGVTRRDVAGELTDIGAFEL